ncbi:hypothetical protein RF11_14827 [Thelohanellus kitauei]|uniref:WW domain-binding protein 11 n=1 Tax=Thelohanellus kitauei TaxID=669202 RepID=A0A0C2JMB4_THEKT|nr:hypothetical protein RF11_14827 [Thelohanellus kitauei]
MVNYFYDPLPPPPPPPPKIVPTTPGFMPHIEQPFVAAAEPNKVQPEIITPLVISADPKLRDMQAEVTKLVPVSVLRKREEKIAPAKILPKPKDDSKSDSKSSPDHAFINFINEVNKL